MPADGSGVSAAVPDPALPPPSLESSPRRPGTVGHHRRQIRPSESSLNSMWLRDRPVGTRLQTLSHEGSRHASCPWPVPRPGHRLAGAGISVASWRRQPAPAPLQRVGRASARPEGLGLPASHSRTEVRPAKVKETEPHGPDASCPLWTISPGRRRQRAPRGSKGCRCDGKPCPPGVGIFLQSASEGCGPAPEGRWKVGAALTARPVQADRRPANRLKTVVCDAPGQTGRR
jgi:hypothetical protein